MLKKLFLGALAVALAGGGYAWWIFNKPHEDIRKMKVYADYTSNVLADAFAEDAEAIHRELADKVILLRGTVDNIVQTGSQALISFDDGGDFIVLSYIPLDQGLTGVIIEGSEVTLRCRYTGYVINDESFLIPADIKCEPCYLEG